MNISSGVFTWERNAGELRTRSSSLFATDFLALKCHIMESFRNRHESVWTFLEFEDFMIEMRQQRGEIV